MTIQNFVKKHSYLFWSTKNFNNLSEEVIVESILNFGDWPDVIGLIDVLGIKKTAKIFKKEIKKKRKNYHPEVQNYFSLYFNKYV